MSTDLSTALSFSVFLIVVLQITTIAVLVRVFASRRIERIVLDLAKQLGDQTDRQSVTLGDAVEAGTQAANAAYEEANTINKKLEQMGIDRQTAETVEPPRRRG